MMAEHDAGSGTPTACPPVLAHLVVALDGPSGSGKSSTARGVARRLGLRYLDTGAMYRAMTWWLLDHGVDVTDPTAVAAHAARPVMTVGTDPVAPTIVIDGVDVSAPIRGAAVTAAVSQVSAVPAVRARLVEVQRALIGAGGVVVEGRDIGTVVFPDADLKLFITASPRIRAERRVREIGGDVDEVEASIIKRDRSDSSRTHSPLSEADDAVTVDTTDLSIDEVVAHIVSMLP